MIPLQKEKNFFLTFFSEEHLNKIGLRKYDFLSLKETLGIIANLKKENVFLEEKNNESLPNFPSYQEIDLSDKKT